MRAMQKKIHVLYIFSSSFLESYKEYKGYVRKKREKKHGNMNVGTDLNPWFIFVLLSSLSLVRDASTKIQSQLCRRRRRSRVTYITTSILIGFFARRAPGSWDQFSIKSPSLSLSRFLYLFLPFSSWRRFCFF